MNKTQLIDAVAEKAGLSKKDAEAAVNAVTQTITDELASGGNVQITGFGNFEVGQRAERNGRNPQTGEAIVIPATTTPKFKPGKPLKEAVKG